jgi:hypothetical protein
MEIILALFFLIVCIFIIQALMILYTIRLKDDIIILRSDVDYIYKKLFNIEFPKNIDIKDIKHFN